MRVLAKGFATAPLPGCLLLAPSLAVTLLFNPVVPPNASLVLPFSSLSLVNVVWLVCLTDISSAYLPLACFCHPVFVVLSLSLGTMFRGSQIFGKSSSSEWETEFVLA